jgi:class 3 adenylate cyclase
VYSSVGYGERPSYSGPGIAIARGLADAGYPGQVLASEDVAVALRGDGVPLTMRKPPLSMISLGNHEISGAVGSIHIFSVLPVEIINRSFPRPKTVSDARRQHEVTERALDDMYKNAVLAPEETCCIVCATVPDAGKLWLSGIEVADKALLLVSNTLRALAVEHSGYLLSSLNSTFEVAFPTVGEAVSFAFDLQMKLLMAKWSPEVLLLPFATAMPRDIPVIRGIRVSAGLHFGACELFVDPLTQAISFRGAVPSIAARLAEAASGGQTLCTREVHAELLADSAHETSFVAKPFGKHRLRTIPGLVDVFEMTPQSLAQRKFAPINSLTTIMGRQSAADAEIAKLLRSDAVPEGPVALVCTDVHGEVSMWDADPDVMVASFELANSLMRQLIREFVGAEVSCVKNCFTVAFSDPLQAVLFALAAQEKLIALDWPAKLFQCPPAAVVVDASGKTLFRGLRVRMGVHYGLPDRGLDPASKKTTYWGPDATLAQSVTDTALGGQIIITEIIRTIMLDFPDKIPDAVVLPLGDHIVKGFEEPRTLFQVLPASLAGRKFGEIRSVSSVFQTYVKRDKEKFEAQVEAKVGAPH